MADDIPDAELIERLTELLKHATPLPWALEQCGEKEDAPVVGVILDENDQPLTGYVEPYNEDGSERDYYRETIAYEWQSCDGHSASANALFVVEAVNALPVLLARLAELQAERTGLREALEPFADFANLSGAGYLPDNHTITLGSGMAARQLTMGDCRKARVQLLAANPDIPPALLRILTENHRIAEADAALAKHGGQQ